MSHNKYPVSTFDRLRHSATLRVAGTLLALSATVVACGTSRAPGQAAKSGKSGTPVATRTSTPKPTTSPTESGQPGSKGLPMSEQCAADSKILDTAFQLGSGAAESSCVLLPTSDTWGTAIIKWAFSDGTLITIDKQAGPMFAPIFDQWVGTSGDTTFSYEGHPGVIDHNGQEDGVIKLPDGTFAEINVAGGTTPGYYDQQVEAAAALLFNLNGVNPYSSPEPGQ